MTEYQASSDQGSMKAQGAVGAESIDLLIRHLEAAKLAFSGPAATPNQDQETTLEAFPNTICTLIYGHTGTFCPLLYLHFPQSA